MKIINNIIFYCIYIIGYIIGKLPLAIQHIISDIGYIIVYRVIRYRLKVVRINLSYSFPEKTEKERRKIERDFYKHLIDIMLESLTMIALSKNGLNKRFKYTNPEYLNELVEQRSVINIMAHYGTWEYTANLPLITSHAILGVYHPLTTKGIDKFYIEARSKFGVEPTPMAVVGREIARRHKDNIIILLISDQNPPINKEKHWFDFLNQKTLFFRGSEMLATRYGMAITYMSIKKVKRGYYEATFVPLYSGTEDIEPQEITRRYTELLELDIRTNPHLWLWTHKRWKEHPSGVNIYSNIH